MTTSRFMGNVLLAPEPAAVYVPDAVTLCHFPFNGRVVVNAVIASSDIWIDTVSPLVPFTHIPQNTGNREGTIPVRQYALLLPLTGVRVLICCHLPSGFKLAALATVVPSFTQFPAVRSSE